MLQEEEPSCISMKGWLLKWTNFVKGYRRRWFVLVDGNLSYYRDKSEIARELRGCIFLLNALTHTYNSCSFVISRCDSKEVFYLKAANPTERKKWIRSLELAKAWAINESEKDDVYSNWLENYNSSQIDIIMNLTTLGNWIEDIHKSNSTMISNGLILKGLLNECKNTKNTQKIAENKLLINNYVTLLQGDSNSIISACKSYLDVAINHYKISYFLWEKGVQNRNSVKVLIEHSDSLLSLFHRFIETKDISLFSDIEKHSSQDMRRRYTLGGVVYTENAESSVVRNALDTRIVQSTHGHTISQLDNETDDLSISIEDSPSQQMFIPDEISRRGSKNSMAYSRSSYCSPILKENNVKGGFQRRKRIPDKPNYPVNLWSIMKTSIGKDLSKIPMPVNFSEPLSFLQRIAEDFAYSHVLDRASVCKDPLEELAYLAAFTVSSYSTTANRTAKPFNPLLGETFEWDRMNDLGWRLITEQVSHHPPIAAQYCQGKGWTCWQEFSVSSKFRGKYISIVPLGISHIFFHNSGNHYSWHKVTTTVNNIILGKLWVDNVGEMDIINNMNASKCHIEYFPYSMFKAEEQRKVAGQVFDSNNNVKWIINGKWDTEINIASVLSKSGKSSSPQYKTSPPITVWTVQPLPKDSHKFYYFSEFACQLNEMEEGIAPTDSRHRPDQRLMEEGNWDEANVVKIALEEKQRANRKKFLQDRRSLHDTTLETGSIQMIAHQHEPKWFKTEMDVTTGKITYEYNGGYWEAKEQQDWDTCPNIFL